MIILKIISSIILYVIPLLSCGQTHTEDYVPYRDVEATDSGIVVTYTFRGGIHQIDPLHDGAKFWKIPGFGLNDKPSGVYILHTVLNGKKYTWKIAYR